MSKIVQAINAMIISDDLITNVTTAYNQSEIFFIFNGKYKWSLVQSSNDALALHYYPTDLSIEDLASIPEDSWDSFTDIVSYRSDELGTKEAKESLAELFTTLKEKRFGMDETLDEIIATGE